MHSDRRLSWPVAGQRGGCFPSRASTRCAHLPVMRARGRATRVVHPTKTRVQREAPSRDRRGDHRAPSGLLHPGDRDRPARGRSQVRPIPPVSRPPVAGHVPPVAQRHGGHELKDPAHEALDDPGCRRAHGVAAQSLFTACSPWPPTFARSARKALSHAVPLVFPHVCYRNQLGEIARPEGPVSAWHRLLAKNRPIDPVGAQGTVAPFAVCRRPLPTSGTQWSIHRWHMSTFRAKDTTTLLSC